ncbi:MAG: heparinase II/III family protein [Bacteroidetes bacterium]|nr:heparinase II/III family protein [Bacteroidota bacterium]
MKLKSIQLTILLVLGALMFSCQKKSDHPRILLLKGQEKAIQQQVATSETWAKMHQTIIDESEKILEQEPLGRIKIGRRLLGTSREYLRRVFFLSYAYRMTGDQRFSKHAEAHMLKSAGFTDWNPSHFLDVGEMTMALAIGYDWLFDELSDETKQTVREAIVEKGIKPSYNDDYNWFLSAEHNWNQVCNAGMTYGALAIMEDYPELADSVINRAFESIPKAMVDYGPDGAYPEGYGYWGYGTSFNMMFLSAVDTWFKDDRSLSAAPGFLETGSFMQNMLLPSNKCYNWGDCGSSGSLQPAMFWLADRNSDPSILWMEKNFLQSDDYSAFTGNRLLPALMIWGKDIPLDKISEPESKVYLAQGKNPICLMRTSWSDPNAVFLGYKTGAASVNHAHMDIGSFVMEADGIRWAMDFGSQNYESLESKGMSIFGRTQDAVRWTIFRLNNYAHSTLTFNNELQKVSGYAKIDKYSDADNFMNAVSDITTMYEGQIKKAIRGVGIKDQKYVVVKDEIETLNKPTKIRWNMPTPAEVELTKNGATLTKDGKTLFLKVQGSKGIQMKIWSTTPTTDYDAENPGTVMVGFECELPANSKESFEVLLIPQSAGISDGFLNKNLDEW